MFVGDFYWVETGCIAREELDAEHPNKDAIMDAIRGLYEMGCHSITYYGTHDSGVEYYYDTDSNAIKEA